MSDEPFGARFESTDVSELDRVARALVAANVRRRRVEWLDVEGMAGRIAKRSVTLLVGDPGLGKSLLALGIGAGVSRNGGSALVATAEDSLEATARPRLDAAQANLEGVAFVQMFADGYPDGLRIPDDVVELERLVAEREASLVVIDPLMAHLPGEVNSWRDQSIRLALAPLHGLAERQGCAVLVVAHLNKSLSSDWIRRVGGSVGLTGAARSVLLMARDPDDPEGEKGRRRVLAHVKCNVGPEMPSLLYEIEPVLIPASGDDPEVETARVVSLGTCDHDGEKLLAGRGDPEERNAFEEAVAFLEEELGDGPADAKVVQRAARDAGISERTLKRAKSHLGVISEHVGGVGGAGHWTWRLRGPSALAPLAEHDVGTLSANPHEERDSAPDGRLRGPNKDIGPLSADPDEIERLHEMFLQTQAEAAEAEQETADEAESQLGLEEEALPGGNAHRRIETPEKRAHIKAEVDRAARERERREQAEDVQLAGLFNARLGDEMFPALLADAAQEGHITEAELAQRLGLHERVTRRR